MTASTRFCLAAACAVALAACGPAYQTDYEYFRPPDADRSCFAQCVSARSACRNDERASRRQTAAIDDLRFLAVESCEDRAKNKKERRKCDSRYGWGGGFYDDDLDGDGFDCEADYRECHIACGGKVRETRVCVSNCGAGG